jgi:hypothetical protein
LTEIKLRLADAQSIGALQEAVAYSRLLPLSQKVITLADIEGYLTVLAIKRLGGPSG